MYVTQAELRKLAYRCGVPDAIATDTRVLLLCNGARLWRQAHPAECTLTKEEITRVAQDLGVDDKVSAHPAVRTLCAAVITNHGTSVLR